MSRHERNGHGEQQFSGREVPTSDRRPASQASRLPSWAILIVGFALWSLIAWIGYALVDPVLGWVAANAGLLLDSGKGIATATGIGKEASSIVDGLDVSGFLGQAIALLRVILKPAIIVFWAIGAVVLLAAPIILPRIGRLLARRRY